MHLGEVVAAGELGEAGEEGHGVVAAVGVLLGEGDGLADLGRRHHEVQPGPNEGEVVLGLVLDALGDGVDEGALAAGRKLRQGLVVRPGAPLHLLLAQADLGAGVPGEERQELVAQTDAGHLEEVAADVDAGVEMDVHGVAVAGAQVDDRGADGDGLGGPLQREAGGQGLGHHLRDIGVAVRLTDAVGQLADGLGLAGAGALRDADLEELIAVQQLLDGGEGGRTAHDGEVEGALTEVADGRAQEVASILPAGYVEGAGRVAGVEKVVIVLGVAGDGLGQDSVQGLAGCEVLEEPEEVLFDEGAVAHAPPSFQGRLDALDAAFDVVQRLQLRHDVGAHLGRVNVQVAEGGVLHDREIGRLAREHTGGMVDGVRAGDRVDGPAVVVPRELRGAGDGEGASGQDGLGRDAGPELSEGRRDDLLRVRLLHEPDELLHLAGEPDGFEHRRLLGVSNWTGSGAPAPRLARAAMETDHISRPAAPGVGSRFAVTYTTSPVRSQSVESRRERRWALVIPSV